jgi:hypothetical protein
VEVRLPGREAIRIEVEDLVDAVDIPPQDPAYVPVPLVGQNGDIVAAMIEGEATVKTFRRAKGQIWLMPHNPAFTPIPGDGATILGKVVTVLRRVCPHLISATPASPPDHERFPAVTAPRSRASSHGTARPADCWRSIRVVRSAYGLMFWLMWKRLPGSYARLT